jgi:hypothetical protein
MMVFLISPRRDACSAHVIMFAVLDVCMFLSSLFYVLFTLPHFLLTVIMILTAVILSYLHTTVFRKDRSWSDKLLRQNYIFMHKAIAVPEHHSARAPPPPNPQWSAAFQR